MRLESAEDFVRNEPASLGSRAKRFNTFPMLIRLINGGGGNFSVQIQPSEACTTRNEKQYGKAKYRCAVYYFVPEGADWAVCKGIARYETQNGEERETPGQSLFAAEKNGNIITHLAHDKYFSLYDIRFKRGMNMTMNERSFNTLTFICGEGTIECGGVKEKFAAGDSFFIPCPAAGYVIKGTGTALMCKLEAENTHKGFDK